VYVDTMKRSLLISSLLFSFSIGICLARSQAKSLSSITTRQKVPTNETLLSWPLTDNAKPSSILRGGSRNPKLISFLTRTLSAIVVLSGLVLFIQNTGNDGIVGLVLAAQIGLFSEATRVAEVTDHSKWWALLMNMLFWDAKHLLPSDKVALINLTAFGMIVLHIVFLVVQQNRFPDFSQSLRSFCVSHVTAAILVGMSSSWLGTLQLFSARWIYYPFLLVIVNDTMAYICGQLIGKRKLLPNISPNKTWEGFIGAAICTVAISSPAWGWIGTGSPMTNAHLNAIGLYVSLVAPFGGFLASSVKRNFGQKDFGTMMPGHGGLVDRLDCQLLTAPFVYLYLTYL
jgi:phosphatidate cytidylyltransferase